MNSSELKSLARKMLSGKWINAYLMVGLYTLLCIAIEIVSIKAYTLTAKVFPSIIVFLLALLKILFGYGLISSLIKLSKSDEPVPYTQFITDAMLGILKVTKLLVRLTLYMIIPTLILATILVVAVFKLLSLQNTITTFVGLAILAISFIAYIVYVSRYALSLFILIDGEKETSKEILDESKKLMKKNVLKYIFLTLSFIGYYLLIGLIVVLSQNFLTDLLINVIETVLTSILTPYITITLYMFYKNIED